MSVSKILNRRTLKKPLFWLSILGPGLVVMLADTDAGSLITAAQSGEIGRAHV